jgi:hypothetical protein
MTKSPREWHEMPVPWYSRADGNNVTSEFDEWSVQESARGPFLHTPRFKNSANVTAVATLATTPTRWNDDARSAITCQLCSPELCFWLMQLEEWAHPKITGPEEARSVVKTNLFGETVVRAKFTSISRYFDEAGAALSEMPTLAAGAKVCVLVNVNLYRANGCKGLTVRILCLQPM